MSWTLIQTWQNYRFFIFFIFSGIGKPGRNSELLISHLEGIELNSYTVQIKNLINNPLFPGLHVTTTQFANIQYNDMLKQLPLTSGSKIGSRTCLYYGKYKYSYNKYTHHPALFPNIELVNNIRALVREMLPFANFNSLLIQHYPTHESNLSLHSDDEPEICSGSWILSISFGATRYMNFDTRGFSAASGSCKLKHGDMILCSRSSKHTFRHGILKSDENAVASSRVSFTFRRILSMGSN